MVLSALLVLALPASASGPFDCFDEKWFTRAAAKGLETYGTCGAETAAAYFAKLFPDGLSKARVDAVLAAPDAAPVPPTEASLKGERVPVSAAVVRKAVRDLSRGLLVTGEVKSRCGTSMNVAYVSWSRESSCEAAACGEIKFEQVKMSSLKERFYDPGGGCAVAFKVDQFGDAMLHELSHAITDYIRFVYKPGTELAPAKLLDKFSSSRHWDGSSPDASCRDVPGLTLNATGTTASILYSLDKALYARDDLGNEQTARLNARALWIKCPDAVRSMIEPD